MAGRIMNTHTYMFEWTYADARCAAEALDSAGLVSMACDIEVQIPRLWKVGDWFIWGRDDDSPKRIVDIYEGVVSYHGRNGYGATATVASIEAVDRGCRCDPPVWWEGDR